MKRFAILFGCFAFLTSPVLATSDFSKQWKAKYYNDNENDDFRKMVRTQACYICHVYKEDKKKVRNEYGKAIHKFLKAEDYPKEWIKENPEEFKKKVYEGLEKAGELKSTDGKTFAEKLKNNEKPAADSGKD